MSWVTHAHYSLLICTCGRAGYSHYRLVYKAQSAAPETQVLLMSCFLDRASLSDVGVKLFSMPLDGNAFASRLNAIVG